MRLILICLFFLSTGILNAQNGTIEGIVIDSETGQAMPYATVSVNIDETLKGTVSDEDGYFSFEKLPIGDYEITVQFLGYKEQVSQRVKVEKDHSRNLLIELESDPVIVEEILIEAFSDEQIICSGTICTFSILNVEGEVSEIVNKENKIAAKQNILEEKPTRLKAYPNPSQGMIQIEIKESVQEVFISNAQGQRLIELGNLESSNQRIDLSSYPVGVYFINYVSQGKVYAEKIILVH